MNLENTIVVETKESVRPLSLMENVNSTQYNDEVTISIPKKYDEAKIIHTNGLFIFLKKIKQIRQINLSFRELTLSKFHLITIEDDENENIDLFMNLGLNPYLKFNDYIISEIGLYKNNTSILLKRVKPFSEKSCIEIENNNSDLIDLNKEYKITEKTRITMYKKDFKIQEWGHNDYIHTIQNENGELVEFEVYEGCDSIMKENNDANYLNMSKQFDEYINIWYNVISVNYDVDYDTPNKESVLHTWKYGHNNKLCKDVKAYEWIKKITHRTYDMVKGYTPINIHELRDEYFLNGDIYYLFERQERKINDICDEIISKCVLLGATSLCNDVIKKDDDELNEEFNKIYDNNHLCRMQEMEYTKIHNNNRIDLIKKKKYKKRHKLKTNISKWFSDLFSNFYQTQVLNSNNESLSVLSLALEKYIENVEEYMKRGNDLLIKKYIENEQYFISVFEEETLYQELHNDSIFSLLNKSLEEYNKYILNNDDWELQTPDIYTLLGFHTFPSGFKREMWSELQDYNIHISNKCLSLGTFNFFEIIVQAFDFFDSSNWYYIYALCCFFAQVIGPSYYIYNYYLIQENNVCPNNSDQINKWFAVAYYLILYARMNSFWDSLTTSVSQYSSSTIIPNNNYLRLTMIVNSICMFIIPTFTYTLFIEMSSITDLILNCLTGEFLINIDNLIVEFMGEESYVKAITKDLMLIAFIDNGYPESNILSPSSVDFWVISITQIVQMIFTLCFTSIVYRCI
jgi:hypothetical protein